jgi:hypothetical protein
MATFRDSVIILAVPPGFLKDAGNSTAQKLLFVILIYSSSRVLPANILEIVVADT